MAIVTDEEFGDFFPNDLIGPLRAAAGDFAIAAPEKAGRAIDLSAILERVAPEIVIASSHTPALPETLHPALRFVCFLAGAVRTRVRRDHLEGSLLVASWSPSLTWNLTEGTPLPSRAILRRQAGMLALRNLRAYAEGRPLEGLVTLKSYEHAP